MTTKLATVILAAGQGTRMKSSLPKVMHRLGGRPMMHHVLDLAKQLKTERCVAVIGPNMGILEKTVKSAMSSAAIAVQQEALGTAHAVLAAEGALKGFAGTLLVLYGDTPCLTAATLRRMVKQMESENAGVAVLGMRPADPAQYGRLVIDHTGALERIVEFKDATPEERAIGLCNSGVIAARAPEVFPLLHRVENKNAKGEYYLTDIIALARLAGEHCIVVEAEEEELLGINSRVQQAEAEALLQQRWRQAAMENGATLIDPASVYFSHDTKLGRDVTIHPNVVFGPGVSVADNVEIRSFCHIEGAKIGPDVVIGPFARLRPGTTLAEGARIGNFVEIKNADIETGAKINHLSYVGDASVGACANIGAGTITCNYDGVNKHRTEIGAGAFIGSNSALIAPVTVGEGALIAAGSTITDNVSADALAIARAPQKELPNRARRFQKPRH